MHFWTETRGDIDHHGARTLPSSPSYRAVQADAHARYQCLSRGPAILLFPVSLLVQFLSELIREFVRVGGRYRLAFLRL